MIRGNRAAHYSLPANKEIGEDVFEDFNAPVKNEEPEDEAAHGFEFDFYDYGYED